MNKLTVYVHTGSSQVNKDIGNFLSPQLALYGISFTTDDVEADIIITRPEYLMAFNGFAILALTDDATVQEEYEAVLDYSPFPVTTDDFLRIEFRLLAIADGLRPADERNLH